MELRGDIDATLAALGVKCVDVGEVRRRSVPVGNGLQDDAVLARWTVDRATVMTHAGRTVVDGVLAACAEAGVRCDEQPGPANTFTESVDEVEVLMLATLAEARSPAAIDLLLDQPRRWRSHSVNPLSSPTRTHRDSTLRRLIEPALVVAVGPPNIGKSSLLNALAGRGISVVADQPGTTRDHVGALIDLGGVVVRWVDTPGIVEGGFDPIQSESQRIALEVAARADVLVVCRDPRSLLASVPESTGLTVSVGLRCDIGTIAGGVDASVSVRDGTGLVQLVETLREAVVPRRFMDDGEPWRFW